LYWANMPQHKTYKEAFRKGLKRINRCGNCFPSVVWNNFHSFNFTKGKLLQTLQLFCRSYGMTLECYHWSHSCPILEWYCINEGIGRAIIDICDGKSVVIVPQAEDRVGAVDASSAESEVDESGGVEGAYTYQDDAFIPPEVDCFEVRIATHKGFLKSLLRAYRKHMTTRGALFSLRREMEQRFANNGNIDPELWCVQLYVSTVCPYVLQLYALIAKGDKFMESCKQEKVRP
jgi:hypothetical protein